MATDATVPDADAQDLAEVFDETNLTEEGDEIANADDIDPDALDDEDLEDEPDDAGPTEQDEAPDSDDVPDERQRRQDELLDEGVEETFPASDPVSVKRIT